MLQDIKSLYGRKLGASDGALGHVKDLYFDDMTWTVRYLVADTGSWLTGRQVLLSPRAFGPASSGMSDPDTLRVHLTRKQIENSPSIDTHRPVSRQDEAEYHRYYGWSTYWPDGAWSGAGDLGGVVPPPDPAPSRHHGHNQRDDRHLHSTKAVTGYRIQATNGPLGSVSSFLVDGKDWTICDLVVETGPWYAGKNIFLRTKNITRISHEDSTVWVNLAIEDLKLTAEKPLAQAGLS